MKQNLVLMVIATLGVTGIGGTVQARASILTTEPALHTLVAGAGNDKTPASAAPAPRSALFNSAVALYNARRYSEAEQYLTQVVKQEPTNSDAFYYLATCQALLGDRPACIRLYKYIV